MFFCDTLQCDAVVMQLEGHTTTASDVLQVLVESELHKDKVFVGVSNLMTWSGTASSKPHKKKAAEGEEGEAEEEEEEAPADDEDAENPDRKEPLEVPVSPAPWALRLGSVPSLGCAVLSGNPNPNPTPSLTPSLRLCCAARRHCRSGLATPAAGRDFLRRREQIQVDQEEPHRAPREPELQGTR